jgi:type IV pilus assembly protein PilM
MFSVLTKKVCPIGVDLGSSYLRMAQLGSNGHGLYLHGVGYEKRPEDIKPGSSDWQKWAVKTIKRMMRQGGFKGKKAVTALPSRDVFIDQIRIQRMPANKVGDAVIANVRQKLPFDAGKAMIKHVVAEQTGSQTSEMDVLVMAADSITVDHHLAIYENAGLDVQSINVWPFAMTNSFVEFFSRRREEQDKVAMLLDMGTTNSNIVICRNRNLLLARVVSLGFADLEQDEGIQRLISEIDACSRYFECHCGGMHIQRLVFLAAKDVDKRICYKLAEMAQRMQIPAQIGDVLTAVDMRSGCHAGIDKCDGHIDWSVAFGLSLSGRENINHK